MGGASVRIDGRALAVTLRSANGPVAQDMYRRGMRVQNRARMLCPVRYGTLRNSIVVEPVVVAGRPGVRIGSRLPYATYVHDGTGIYGPRGSVIRPRSARVLAWQTPGGQRAFARYVRGQRPRPFLRDALPAAA